jgi:hypothetical protein
VINIILELKLEVEPSFLGLRGNFSYRLSLEICFVDISTRRVSFFFSLTVARGKLLTLENLGKL